MIELTYKDEIWGIWEIWENDSCINSIVAPADADPRFALQELLTEQLQADVRFLDTTYPSQGGQSPIHQYERVAEADASSGGTAPIDQATSAKVSA